MSSVDYSVKVLVADRLKLKKKLSVIIDKCNANPAEELIKLRVEVLERMEKRGDNYTPEFSQWLEEAVKRERKLVKSIKNYVAEWNKADSQQREIQDKIQDVETALYRLSRSWREIIN